MDPHSAERTAAWYRSPAGRRAAGLLRVAVRPLLRTSATTRLLAIGADVVLDGFDPASVERIALVSALGSAWPPAGPGLALAADPAQLPFVEAVFDTALVMHALETSEAPRRLLRELWRTLSPAGDIVVVVPNRSGSWALTERNPFGEGRPYGRGGLRRALGEAMFEIVDWRMALCAPPLHGLGWSEGVIARIASRRGGVHVVRARKRDGLAPPIAGDRARARLRPAMTAAPRG